MATLSTRGKSRFIQFTFREQRQTLSLGRVDRKRAEAIRLHIESILSSKALAQPVPFDTAKWVKDIGGKLHARMADIGLVEPRHNGTGKLDEAIDAYIENRRDLKESSRIKFRQAKRVLCDWFGSTKNIQSITRNGAVEWQQQLSKRFATATVSARVKDAKTIFGYFVRMGMIESNPFSALKAGSQVNDSRLQYIPASDVELLTEHCSVECYKRIILLARLGGLRIPSESNMLRWKDVDFDRDRMRITSPKTEHHAGKDHRWMAIVPALRTKLEAWKKADESRGEVEFVARTTAFGRMRKVLINAINTSGLKPWPRLFQNLRASCQTDLLVKIPLPIACKMIGNSATIASKHYVVPADHFYQLLGGRTLTSAALGAATGIQNVSEKLGTDVKPEAHSGRDIADETAESADFEMGDKGLEPLTPSV